MDRLLYKPNNSIYGYNLLMAYPACESFALSSLGYLWLAKLAEELPWVNAEKIYTDSTKISINPQEADAIAFSISFDFDFMGVFSILDKYNIPFLSKERNNNFPLIFAGGPVISTNPEPYKNFYDFMIIGDGEEVFLNVLKILSKKMSKKETLLELSTLDGVYVPNLSGKVIKNTVIFGENIIYTPIISDKSYFKDTFIIEVSRGCMNRCAFCTASYLNLPFRANSFDKIIEVIELGLQYTNKIALLGAQISAHPQFDDIIKYIEDKIDDGNDIELSISSLRTDSISPELIRTLVKSGQKTSTIAIEAASERLRKFINKNLNEEQILNAVKISRENGLKGLKIYSMIGIPSETQEDIDEFIRLAKLIKEKNKGFGITFSFSTFVPKPQTPLQWAKREDTKSLEKKQKYLEKELAKIGLEVKFSSAKWDYWQTILSRGDDTLTDFLIEVYKQGGKIGAFKAASKTLQPDISKMVEGYVIDESLPWDFIQNYPTKQLLLNEYNRLSKYL
ncbi:MAG: radical SAM protein [Cyanobacteria bacterium SIG31]|nr:radical SAM protein [Cyanobacteria bacterium SIG31]